MCMAEFAAAILLDEIGQWVSSYAVTLYRRPGVGVWLKGEKLSCRRAAAALLQSSLTEEELQAVLRGNFAAGGAFAALLNTKLPSGYGRCCSSSSRRRSSVCRMRVF